MSLLFICPCNLLPFMRLPGMLTRGHSKEPCTYKAVKYLTPGTSPLPYPLSDQGSPHTAGTEAKGPHRKHTERDGLEMWYLHLLIFASE